MKWTPIPVLLATAALAACGGPDRSRADTTSAPPSVTRVDAVPRGPLHVFECAELDFSVEIRDTSLLLHLPERSLQLPQVPAASGARYQDAQTLFWNRGDTALLIADGRRHEGCQQNITRIPRDALARRPVDFRATGNQPGWFLEIVSGDALHLHTDYGRRRLVADELTAVAHPDGIGYRGQAGDHDLLVVIEERPCQDSLSDQTWANTVTVQLDDQSLPGCGVRLK